MIIVLLEVIEFFFIIFYVKIFLSVLLKIDYNIYFANILHCQISWNGNLLVLLFKSCLLQSDSDKVAIIDKTVFKVIYIFMFINILSEKF